MPEVLEGSPSREQMDSPLLYVGKEDESRLLSLAKAKGVEDGEAYTFSVIAVAGIPCNQLNSPDVIPKGSDLDEKKLTSSWTVFAADELRAEAKKLDRFVYDEEKSRLVHVGPSVGTIIKNIRKPE